jgi:hypothetical protein
LQAQDSEFFPEEIYILNKAISFPPANQDIDDVSTKEKQAASHLILHQHPHHCFSSTKLHINRNQSELVSATVFVRQGTERHKLNTFSRPSSCMKATPLPWPKHPSESKGITTIPSVFETLYLTFWIVQLATSPSGGITR